MSIYKKNGLVRDINPLFQAPVFAIDAVFVESVSSESLMSIYKKNGLVRDVNPLFQAPVFAIDAVFVESVSLIALARWSCFVNDKDDTEYLHCLQCRQNTKKDENRKRE